VAQKRRGAASDTHKDTWARYAAPAAFLLAATIAILLVRSGLQGAGDSNPPAKTTIVRTTPAKATTTKTKPRQKPTTTGAAAFYTVAAGDTFGTIASKNGTSVAELERLNPGVKSTSLFVGQKIRVK
jgi:LysM repeat protein